MIITGKCKFCGCSVRLNIADDCSPIHLEKWLPLAACNRCADFERAIYKLTDRVTSACYAWRMIVQEQQRRQLPEETEQPKEDDRIQKLRSAMIAKLTSLTKVYMTAVNRYRRRTNVWSPEIVEALMERPELARGALGALKR